MTPQSFATILIFAAPMFSAIICCAMVFSWGRMAGSDDHRPIRALTGYFMAGAIANFGVLIYPFFPRLFAYTQAFMYLGALSEQVAFYNFVFNVTRLDPAERFPRSHYLLPLLITGTLFVWSFFVPFDVQVFLAENKGLHAAGYGAYSQLFLSKIYMMSLYSIVYMTLSIVRLTSYKRRVADYSANESRSALRWLNVLIILSLCLLPLPLGGFIAGREVFYTSLILAAVSSAIVVAQHIVLTLNTLQGNYITHPENEANVVICDAQNDPSEEDKEKKARHNADKASLEEYMQSAKPYLNPDLRITNLVDALKINRTYLSELINAEYGMNFSRYINNLRLRELEEHIQQDPATRDLAISKQILLAGFGSYRNYKRFKEAEETQKATE